MMTSTTRYFADTAAGVIELNNPNLIGGKWYGYDENKQPLKIDRKINYKTRPSKHVCDARCIGATGRAMTCECSCGGKNHGKGH